MEGGKQMITKKIFKSIFITSLSFILVCMSIICAADLSDSEQPLSNEIDYSKLKYEIINRNKMCQDELEKIYSTENEIYYTYCKNDVYIKWEDGEIDLLEDALVDKKIDINDLGKHNIKIVVEDKHEN